MASSHEIELAFKQYFPKLIVISSDNKGVTAKFDKDSIIDIIFYPSNLGIYTSEIWFGNEDFLYLYQSADLVELMQGTKFKLNEMFADWISKVN